MRSRRLVEAGALAALAIASLAFALPLAAQQPSEARQLAVASLGLVVCPWLAARARARLPRAPAAQRLGLHPGRARAPALLLLVGGTVALSHGLDGVLELSGWREHSALADLDLRLEGARGRDLALALLGIGIAPGIAEEVLCRGFVQRGLERRLPAGLAIGLAALFFGGLHLDPIHAAFAAVLGLYLGAAAWLAGSTRASILCHVVNNLAAVGVIALLERTPFLGPAGVVSGFAVAAGCLWLARRAIAPGAPPPALQRQPGAADG
jgi:membrane protease YdiL (CAAX protease family)